MAKYILPRLVLPELTISEFLVKTGLTLKQTSDLFGWPYDTIKRWSATQGPPTERDRQLLAQIIETRLLEINALLGKSS